MKVKLFAIVTTLFVFCFVYDTISGLAREFEEHPYEITSEHPPKYKSMIATAYCIDGTTASGTHTRQGIAAAKKEWIGKTAKVYRNANGSVGELIGEYVIEDTGGESIQNGSVIDIWMPTRDECLQFGRRLVYVEIVD